LCTRGGGGTLGSNKTFRETSLAATLSCEVQDVDKEGTETYHSQQKMSDILAYAVNITAWRCSQKWTTVADD
jgi:hypothetical protein